MSDMIESTRVKIWEFRMAIMWFFLFSVNALCSCMIAALTGAKWHELDAQSKFMIVVAITGNWTGTIMAFVSKQAQRIQKSGLPFPQIGDDTTFVTKTHTETDAVKVSPPTTEPPKL